MLTLALLAAPLAADAQPAGKLYRIGFLHTAPAPPFGPPNLRSSLEQFRQGLRELGYVEGRDFVIEGRFADTKVDRLPILAAELVSLKVDVIVANGTPPAKAAMAATATIPIVFKVGSDPDKEGLVASFARPGGNVTGLTENPGPEIAGKALELFKEAVPRISRVAVPYPSNYGPLLRVLLDVAPKLGITLLPHGANTLNELTAALAAITRQRADGLFLFGSVIHNKHFSLILEFAARNGLPTMCDDGDAVEAGGLMAYSTNGANLGRRTATVVDKILKGAKPGDLPVERPTKFDLAVNLKDRQGAWPDDRAFDPGPGGPDYQSSDPAPQRGAMVAPPGRQRPMNASRAKTPGNMGTRVAYTKPITNMRGLSSGRQARRDARAREQGGGG